MEQVDSMEVDSILVQVEPMEPMEQDEEQGLGNLCVPVL